VCGAKFLLLFLLPLFILFSNNALIHPCLPLRYSPFFTFHSHCTEKCLPTISDLYLYVHVLYIFFSTFCAPCKGRPILFVITANIGTSTSADFIYMLEFCFVDFKFTSVTYIFFLLALQPQLGVVFYSPLAGFSLLAYEIT